MIIIGINEGHDSGACLFVDGRILAAASEERFSRRKNDCGWPRQAVEYCLAFGKIARGDVDKVAIATIALDPIEMRIKRGCNFGIADYLYENESYWKPKLLEGKDLDFGDFATSLSYFTEKTELPYDFSFLSSCSGSEERARLFREARRQNAATQLGVEVENVAFLDHHLCHAAYAYFGSASRERTMIITADGFGDGVNSTIGIGEGDFLKLIFKTPRNDLARIYRWSTLLLGMKPNEHEYKVMGLAPYAKNYLKKEPYEIYRSTLQCDGLDFSYGTKPSDLYYWFKDRFAGFRFDGIAGALQQFTEDVMVEWVTNCVNHFGLSRIAFSGGLALNIKVNKRIAELEKVDVVSVLPGGGDTSVGVGAAYAEAARSEGGDASDIAGLRHAYLGPESSDGQITQAITDSGANLRYKIKENASAELVAEHLARGKIIARLCGRMEFGARALGNRSILAHPGRIETVQAINETIKNRDFWMPFTPSILEDRSGDYLINPKGLEAPFMTVAFDSTKLARRDLMGAMHPYDKTLRPHIVSAEINPEYHRLIKAFEMSTGIGALLNTSFNLHGEPVVCSAEDALHTFEHSNLDMLLMKDTLISRER